MVNEMVTSRITECIGQWPCKPLWQRGGFDPKINGITAVSHNSTNRILGMTMLLYCTHFKGQVGVTIQQELFQVWYTNLNSINFDRPYPRQKPYGDPIIMWLPLSSGPEYQMWVTLLLPGFSGFTVAQESWYNLLLTTVFTGVQWMTSDINAGKWPGGHRNDPPIPTGFTNAVLHASILIADTAIEASMSVRNGVALSTSTTSDLMEWKLDNCVSTALMKTGRRIFFIQHNK